MQPKPDPTADPPLIGVAECARLIGLPRSSVYRYLKAGLLSHAVVDLPGCRLLLRRRLVEEWLAGNEVQSSQ